LNSVTNSAPSVQLYTVRDAIAADLTGALERIAGLGFSTVELYGFVERATEYAAILPRLGLSAPTAHSRLVGEDLDPIFEAAGLLGVDTIIEPGIDPPMWTTEQDVVASAVSLNRVAEKAAAHGLTVGYHNHWWEIESILDGRTALELFESQLADSVVLEVDTYWVEVGGLSAADLLQRLGSRVRAIHVKDGDISRDNKKQLPVGSGQMPVLQILAAAPGALRVVELDDYDGDVFDALAASIAFLRANGEA
jgi:sugar phosphate isomerase/epimerase